MMIKYKLDYQARDSSGNRARNTGNSGGTARPGENDLRVKVNGDDKIMEI